MSMALASIFIMTACTSEEGPGSVETRSANSIACMNGVRPGTVLNMREGTNNQDEEEARQVIASLNGAAIPLAEYSARNQYGQFTFVVSRPDGIYGSDILEPSNADVGYIVYNQYGTSWFKKRTCDTLLAAGRRGVHLLLVGDRLADIDPTSPDISTPAARTEFEACISELTHLVPLPANTAAPTTVTGLLGGAASPPVPYLDALRTSALFSPAADVTAATAPLAAGTTPVAVAFERTPDGARTIAMNFRISRAATADGRQRLSEGLTAAMVALRGCSRDPFVPVKIPVCADGGQRNARRVVEGTECRDEAEVCVGGEWTAARTTRSPCQIAVSKVPLYAMELRQDYPGQESFPWQSDYIFLNPTSNLAGEFFADHPNFVPIWNGAPVFYGFATDPDPQNSRYIRRCSDARKALPRPRHYLEPLINGSQNCSDPEVRSEDGLYTWGLPYRFEGSAELLHFINTLTDGKLSVPETSAPGAPWERYNFPQRVWVSITP